MLPRVQLRTAAKTPNHMGPRTVSFWFPIQLSAGRRRIASTARETPFGRGEAARLLFFVRFGLGWKNIGVCSLHASLSFG